MMPSDIVVVATDEYDDERLRSLNRLLLDLEQPWLVCSQQGTTCLIGPVFRPGSFCWECLEARYSCSPFSERGLKSNSAARLLRKHQRERMVTGSRLFAELVALYVAQFVLARDACEVFGAMHVMDMGSLSLSQHILSQRGGCVCTSPEVPTTIPQSRLKSGNVILDNDGRSWTAQQVIANCANIVSNVLGEISDVVEVGTGTRHPIFVAWHGLSSPAVSDHDLRAGRIYPTMSAGKGLSADCAKASAIAECIERLSTDFRGNEERVAARHRELEGAIELSDLLLFSDTQYCERAKRNSEVAAFDWIPEPCDSDTILDWSRAWSLVNDREMWIPTGYSYFSYPWPARRYCIANSNGCAAAATLTEAITHGLLELIERDAVAMWWYNRLHLPQLVIDFASIEAIQRLEEDFRAIDRTLKLFRLTHDLGVSVVAAVSYDMSSGRCITFGFGADTTESRAVVRAVGELLQLQPALLGYKKDPGNARVDRELRLWWEQHTVESDNFLASNSTTDWSNSLVSRTTINANRQLEELITTIKRAGLDVIALDLSRREFPLHVARVIVPGLRHFWRRFAPGRLYDVPIQLGWRATQTEEEMLNPVGICF